MNETITTKAAALPTWQELAPMMAVRHLHVDFEALALGDKAVQLSVALVAIDPQTDAMECCEVVIDPRGVVGEISASTVLWWLEQATKNPVAAKRIFEAVKAADRGPEDETDEAIDAWARVRAYTQDEAGQIVLSFLAGLPDLDKMPVWANGAVDHAWLSTLFDRAGLRSPIGYWQQCDLRTLRALNPGVKADEHEWLVKHTALGDAVYQAMHGSKILREMNGWPHPREIGHDAFAIEPALWPDWAVATCANISGHIGACGQQPTRCAPADPYSSYPYSAWVDQDGPTPVVADIGPISYAASLSSLRLRPEQPVVTEQQPAEA